VKKIQILSEIKDKLKSSLHNRFVLFPFFITEKGRNINKPKH